MKTAIVVDSGSNIYTEDIKLEGLFSIPLQIIEKDTAFLEGVEITTHEVNKKMEDNIMLQTSLPVLGQIETLFSEIKKQGYEQIFAVPITSGLSSTVGAMQTAAQLVDIPFDYIDCYTTMHIQLFTAIRAYNLFQEGLSNSDVKTELELFIQNSNTYIIPQNLEHLSRGGRLSPIAAKLGGLLRIKPILFLDKSTGGVIESFEKVRTMTKAVDHVINSMKKEGVDENYQITFTHVEGGSEAQKALEKIKEAFPNTEILERDLISTVSVHVGLGAIALQYMKKTSL